MYGMAWLIGLTLLGVLAGLGAGYLLAGRRGGQRNRELEAQLSSARKELADYRQEVVNQFSETARKFQTLNDSYTDLHEQLARSSSVLCGDLTGPLLEAPAGHQDLLPREARRASEPAPPEPASEEMAGAETPAPTGVADPYDDASPAADGLNQDIRVPEPAPQQSADPTAAETGLEFAAGNRDESTDGPKDTTDQHDTSDRANATQRAAAGP